MKRKDNYIKSLQECPINDVDCPYYDWKYQKCAMFAKTNSLPQYECDGYIMYMDEEEE